ncbi:hypothetical protein M430DRAFT_152660 [Amorphotheca resinae ATCC 22711]|uniref:Uncharacterized protein n=1 Tax=Amorphotheca resinae ATCC 22711 TaxID=857342 RepID=A0A2T3BD50_AMORE|nr:hypothetical protein M430DRAFT_152660 [Amorphotheca resinae ATCC 22711]PSS27316.1 hypothetical protein M430DRAFT_152660 [Amorphotheca resinae ATCC 22711]
MESPHSRKTPFQARQPVAHRSYLPSHSSKQPYSMPADQNLSNPRRQLPSSMTFPSPASLRNTSILTVYIPTHARPQIRKSTHSKASHLSHSTFTNLKTRSAVS